MTLSDLIQTDVDDVFFTTDEFAEVIKRYVGGVKGVVESVTALEFDDTRPRLHAPPSSLSAAGDCDHRSARGARVGANTRDVRLASVARRTAGRYYRLGALVYRQGGAPALLPSRRAPRHDHPAIARRTGICGRCGRADLRGLGSMASGTNDWTRARQSR